MDDSISRQSAIEILGKHCNMDYGKVCGKDCECVEYMALRDLPSAQPTIEPRAKGHWVPQKGGGCYCSECEEYALDEADGRYISVSVKSNFCPNCGADMRGEQDG